MKDRKKELMKDREHIETELRKLESEFNLFVLMIGMVFIVFIVGIIAILIMALS